VIVTGRLKQRSYETKEGEKRTVYEVEIDDIGPALRYATAKIQKTSRGSSTGSPAAPAAAGGGSSDPWGSPGGGDSWGGGAAADEPPF
jgi:single-strand DNA-binding protein